MPRKSTPRKQKALARRKTALQLHVEGHTFAAIGAKLGVSKQRAHQLVQEQIEEAAKDRSALATKALDTDLERIDFVLRSLAPKVERGDDKAASAYLRALDRRARLLGLDSPDRSELSGPNGSPIAVVAPSPEVLHSRVAAAATRAARVADPGAAREPDGDGES